MRLKRRPRPDTGAPTKERLAHAENWRLVGDARSGSRPYQIQTPLDRLFVSGRLSGIQHDALQRFWEHWTEGQLAGNLRSPDMNRITASVTADPLAARRHREVFDQMWDRLDIAERHVVSGVVLFEISVAEVARCLGFRSPFHGREAVTQLLRDAAERLARC